MAISSTDLQARYIGEVITLVEIDIPSGPTLRYTPSNSSNITFGGATYKPLPMSGSGFGATSGAFKDASLSVSNVDKEVLGYMNQYENLENAKVRFFQTLSKHLGNSSKTMNEANYVISEGTFNNSQIDFTLTHPLNQEGVHLPLRIMSRQAFPSIGKYRG